MVVKTIVGRIRRLKCQLGFPTTLDISANTGARFPKGLKRQLEITYQGVYGIQGGLCAWTSKMDGWTVCQTFELNWEHGCRRVNA